MILSNKNFSISFSNHKSKDFSVVYIAIILTIMKGCKLTYDTNLNRNLILCFTNLKVVI